MLKNRSLRIKFVKDEDTSVHEETATHIITPEQQEIVKDLVDYVGIRALIGTATVFGLATLSKVVVKSIPTR